MERRSAASNSKYSIADSEWTMRGRGRGGEVRDLQLTLAHGLDLPQQSANAGERFGWKAHGHLELIIALEDVWLALPPAKGFPGHRAAQPGEVAVNRHGIIAPLDQSRHQRLAQTFRDVAPADGHVEGAGVAVKPGKAAGHLGEDVKVFRVKQAAFGSAMGGDYRDAAFHRQGQNGPTGKVCSPPVCASSGSLASAIRSQKRVKRRSLQLMFWQLGRHFIITAPADRQRSNSSTASGRAGWIETAGKNSACSLANLRT